MYILYQTYLICVRTYVPMHFFLCRNSRTDVLFSCRKLNVSFMGDFNLFISLVTYIRPAVNMHFNKTNH